MSYYEKAEKLVRKRSGRKPSKSEEIKRWRKYWGKAGPVRFAEEVLASPRDVPPYPNWKNLQKKIYCKGCEREHDVFRPNGIPYHIILSGDQKEYLEDLWLRTFKAILTAGRGAGKTFTWSIWICWCITCFDYYDITSMGGSLSQSKIARDFVDYWRMNSKKVNYCIPKSHGGVGTAPYVQSKWGSTAYFPPCSETSARGPHIRDLGVDEACVAESKSEEGRKAVRSARYQITGTPNSHFVEMSTAHYIFGSFYETLLNAEKLGFKTYRWSIARHVTEPEGVSSKERNWNLLDNVLYKDLNPKNWRPNVWWVTQDDIEDLRASSSNDEWLVEALGGISIGSGLVFGPDDLKYCICDREECKECLPWTKSCPLVEELKLGKKMEKVTERKCGIDFGERAPDAQTILGRRGKLILVLFSEEVVGLGEEDKLIWIDKNLKRWNTYEVFADPEERAMKWALENLGYAIPELWAFGGGAKKKAFVSNARRWVERRLVIIPRAFVDLIKSLKQIAFSEKGKVIKHNDHSFDSFIYGMSDYDVTGGIGQLWKIKNRGIDRIW